jgi:hypothetical protein
VAKQSLIDKLLELDACAQRVARGGHEVERGRSTVTWRDILSRIGELEQATRAVRTVVRSRMRAHQKKVQAVCKCPENERRTSGTHSDRTTDERREWITHEHCKLCDKGFAYKIGEKERVRE